MMTTQSTALSAKAKSAAALPLPLAEDLTTIKRHKRILFTEKAMSILFLLTALTSIVAVALICLFLFSSGLPTIFQIGIFKFLGGTKWAPTDSQPQLGILPMILGSICVTLGAVVVGVPIGILTAVYMACICPKWLYRFLKPALDLLAGIPSIVYGFFGLMVLVPQVRNIFGGSGKSLLAASVLLGIMILPTVIGLSESSIRAVPDEYYEGALALGASHTRAVYYTVFPAAKSGILASVVLGIGRAIGETMAVIMVAGNQTLLPRSLTKGLRTMTANIVIEMGYASGIHRQALIATGVVLFVFILLINLCVSLLRRRQER